MSIVITSYICLLTRFADLTNYALLFFKIPPPLISSVGHFDIIIFDNHSMTGRVRTSGLSFRYD